MRENVTASVLLSIVWLQAKSEGQTAEENVMLLT